MLKAFLAERGIEYIDRDVSIDQSAVFELVRTYNSRSTPTVVIGDEVLIGFDPEQIEKLLAQ
ncbi:MAG TPA: glutaredoxin family protein [Clostridia bacterium]|nr:glutaredoxin family protein [Clostridia bacterium]